LEPAGDAPENLWIAPLLFDLQVNGFGGIDFQQDGLTAGELLSATKALRAAGCGRCLVTLITDQWERLLARLAHLRALRAQSPELLRAIAGWHVEGPFLSSEPGFHGTHNPAFMRDPKPEDIATLRDVTGDDPLLLTIAPERPGAVEVIASAVSHGMQVSLGHTDASSDMLAAAVRAGARGFTHLGNGCPSALNRHDNILWRVLDEPGLTVSLIPDGIHVPPPLFRILHRALPPERIYYITDAMSAAGASPGRYRLGQIEVEVGLDRVVRRPGSLYLSGSALSPVDGVFKAAFMTCRPWQETWARFSEAPAKLMGLTQELIVGGLAEFCLVRVAAGGELEDLQCTGFPAVEH